MADSTDVPVTPTAQSITLPRNFSFHYTDAPPKTPEPIESQEPLQPPQPPKVRIRRRRPAADSGEDLLQQRPAQLKRVPTIELSESDKSNLADFDYFRLRPQSGYLSAHQAPPITAVFQPQTPAPKSISSSTRIPSLAPSWMSSPSKSESDTLSRPSTAFSSYSDSSASSFSSAGSSPSFGESCTSPENEISDPFTLVSPQKAELESPIDMETTPQPKRLKMHTGSKWTVDMDEHLWTTYMAYLADPTVTPFKMLPGTAPPLGVCHRVAREAKKTWKGSKTPLPSVPENGSQFESLDTAIMRESSVPPPELTPFFTFDNERPHSAPRLQRAESSKRTPGRWPRSQASTRRRLRELCKRKPNISPHYTRMMQSRSPSPFESNSSSRHFSSRFASPRRSDMSSDSFSTRDLNVGLTTSTAASMQLDGPLAQLTSEGSVTSRRRAFHTMPGRLGAHQKSQSLQLGLGLDGSNSMRSYCALASPFQELPEPQFSMDGQYDEKPSFESSGTIRASSNAGLGNTSNLSSPFEIHAPRPTSNSMKRRAQYDLGDEPPSEDLANRRNFLEDSFRDPATIGNRRVRARGFSLSAMRTLQQPERHLSDLFTPPSAGDNSQTCNLSEDIPMSNDSDSLHLGPPALPAHIQRLGSPFAPAPSIFSNTFPRSIFPRLLDQHGSSTLEHPFGPEPRSGNDGSGRNNDLASLFRS